MSQSPSNPAPHTSQPPAASNRTSQIANRKWPAFWHRVHTDTSGATATEYILILALVVLPIALMSPLFLHMIKVYGTRVLSPVAWPFP